MARVLVIDDDVPLSGMVQDWLSREEHSVHVVHTGLEGWQQIKTGQFELIILDWDLPDIHGIDIIKRFRASGGTTPIILLTGHTSVDDKESGLDSGANDYLTKPFHLKELSVRIRTLFRNLGAAPAPPKALGAGNEAVLNRANLAGTALAAKYEFLEVLGEGGLGLVFKARHAQMGKLVAVKMLQADTSGELFQARFEREAKALCRLDHQNIVSVFDFGVTEYRQPYMVIEHIEGKDLDTILETEEFIPLDAGLEIMAQVCDGLAHAHEMGILHRDMKPGNIMLKKVSGKSPIPKILDFGLAKLKDPESQDQIALTQTGQVFGSPPYMSPEQIRGRQLDERSDIYSVGCMLYEIFTGCPPFVADQAVKLMLMHLESAPESMRKVRPDLNFPEELDRIVLTTLAKDPAKRFPSMNDLRDALQWVQYNRTTQAQQ
jgi:serine/threonine protein kinase